LEGGRVAYGKSKIFLGAIVHDELRTARTALQASYAKRVQVWPIQDILSLVFFVCKNQASLYYPRLFALPTLLQYSG